MIIDKKRNKINKNKQKEIDPYFCLPSFPKVQS